MGRLSKPARALVIGGSGLVGNALMRELRAQNIVTVGTHARRARQGLQPLDITDPIEVRRCIMYVRPTMIFLTAALTHVDLCEENPEKATKINVEGPRSIAREAARLGVRVVFFSSDYIFDGEAGPYDENAVSLPLNVYGQTKLDAEEAVRESLEDSLIIRTTVVYGWEPDSKNFAMQVYQRVRAGEQFTVPSDQVSNPTLVEYLAQTSVALAFLEVRGIVNVVGKDLVTRADFARALVRTFGGSPALVVPVLTAKLSQKARRPLKGGLRTNKLAELLGRDVAIRLDDAMTRLRHRYMNAPEHPSYQRPS